ncbi:beta-galactosidase [Dactylosporangium matsuzakiense]|uniref:Beta-galactosidase n=1 Tax=Dactylosporangium matsuzakiense TaxID=53360 RepID=A0A9W6KW02_9ACTN|nr:beta-galactosidase [Dactylosporangium matsuzakiense]GLL08227.1 beta-galactosidase [Dactylosporangium matsuzakiense]
MPTNWPVAGLGFGGDYNPEQWSPEVWDEDVRLMTEAGVNLVTLGVFSWGALEVADGVFEWTRQDRIIDLLHRNGISVDLATPTASPPLWLQAAHPEILPVNADMTQRHPGARDGWCANSATFRRYALRMTKALAERYAAHPAVVLWHVSNEIGGGNGRCYCDQSLAAFREWLRERYGSLDDLNRAWGTAFWGLYITGWDHVPAPRGNETHNPALMLDYDRFCSDSLLEHFRAERDVIREFTPTTPITTNFMVGPHQDVVDYPRWAEYVDIVANDHYTIPFDPLPAQDIAFSADRVRGMTPGRGPWLLMEHSVSAHAWHPVNRAKAPRELIRDSLGHIARGADGALFFQWRASLRGAEQFLQGIVPHAGPDSKIGREVRELGAVLGRLAEVRGSTVAQARVALLFDDEAGWAFSRGLKPHRGLDYGDEPRAWHRALWDRNVLVDVLPPEADLGTYDLVIVPTLFLVHDDSASRLAAVTRRGGVVVVTWMSGIVDHENAVRAGGHPAAFRELVGVRSEEFFPLPPGERGRLDSGAAFHSWSELMDVTDAEVIARYAEAPLTGRPAVTRRAAGSGAAYYVSCALAPESLDALVGKVLDDVDIEPSGGGAGLDVVRREKDGTTWVFALNHGAGERRLTVKGVELVTGETVDHELVIPGCEVRVVRERGA